MVKRGKISYNKISYKIGNKRAQFYIIAAVIIISVIVGFAIYRNYAKIEKEQVRIYDLGKELGIETGYVYDYGIYNKNNTNELIQSWLYNYSSQEGIVEDWFFIYGDKGSMTALYFTKQSSGGICIEGAGGSSCVSFETITPGSMPVTLSGEGTVKVKFLPENFTYSFELKEGQNFFFVIRSKEASVKG